MNMAANRPAAGAKGYAEAGSTFIIVLWVAFGLVSIALYFAHSMSFEMRAADNRVCGVSAEQAIEGAARYVSSVLGNQVLNGSNGFVPDPASYVSEAVPVGDAHFWLIGRDTNSSSSGTTPQMTFALVDEASKINLNSASSNTLAGLLQSLPRANPELAAAILDWRDTNATGVYQTYYATRPSPYTGKSAAFETLDELRLVYGADTLTLSGEDLNRNGVLDPNETDDNHNGIADPGVLDYVTVYSREPNIRTNGSPRVNVRVLSGSTGPLPDLLQTAFNSTRANQILANLGLVTIGPVGPGAIGGGGGKPNGPGAPAAPTVILILRSPLEFYVRSRMTADEFAAIANDITVANGSFIDGRVNINTASATVLASLPGLNSNPDLAQTLVSYRQSNPDKLGSIAWIVDALGQNNSSVLSALEAEDALTTQSYQFTADIAALGPNGRGFRRVKFLFDLVEGTPKILYRQDLTQLGWALGKDARQTWLTKVTR